MPVARLRECLVRLALAVLVVVGAQGVGLAAVTRIEITQREPFNDGEEFGPVGPYEQLTGKAYFAVDPQAPANAAVVDLPLAPRNAAGSVEFSADIHLLAPRDLSQASGLLLYDVNNRGNRLCPGMFNTGSDGFLMRHGIIVVSSGWIAEVLPGGGRLRLQAPVARQSDGSAITGLVRADFVLDVPSERVNISYGANNGSFVPSDQGLAEATLTWRLREADPRVPIPRDQWRLELREVTADGQRGQLPLVELVCPGGLKAGYVYELIYEAQDPIVQGLGLAGIRDLVSFLRHDVSAANPLALKERSAARRTVAFGVSQSGRCLRQFLYDGFNADEAGRAVFDGLMPHVAGGGLGFFNHRFASPTRHNTQHDNHLFPVDIFPFAYGEERDPFTGRDDSLLRKAQQQRVVPKVMHIQTTAEYWSRAGSLVHTDPLGQRDSEIPDDVRLYTIGGAQHGPGSGLPGQATTGQLPHNPTDYRPILRALLLAMDRWIGEGLEPPSSRYPTLAQGTLVDWRQANSGWRALPGIRYPEVIHQPEWRDFGSRFGSERIVTEHPPQLRGHYPVLVPRAGPDNNDQGTIQVPLVAVPLGTFTGWNLRSPSIGAENELLSLAGGYIPLARTREQRLATGDPRPALTERYGDADQWEAAVLEAAQLLHEAGFLLPEEFPRQRELARQQRAAFGE